MHKVLIIGSGGREHALAWKFSQSEKISHIYVAPGNAGTAQESPKVQNIPIEITDISKLCAFAKEEGIELTIVGPEAPLVMGIVDAFQAAGLLCLGPSQAAAQLEGSKAFSKAFLQAHHIPTAAYATFTDLNKARAYLRIQRFPLVIKADGLAAGKGVVIARNLAEADAGVSRIAALGPAGSKIIIEQFLEGEEISFIVLTDGIRAVPFPTSQDHKRRNDGDLGPNTGGMGAYTPAPRLSGEEIERVMRQIIYPTLEGMAAQGTPFRGFLYAGLMMLPSGEPYVLEFNARLGDPEAQVLLMRLNSDIFDLFHGAVTGNWPKDIRWDPRPALGVIMTSGSYPESVDPATPIQGLDLALTADQKIFHAATFLRDQQVFAHGGRILCVAALGATLEEAQAQAYACVTKITWNGVHYRKDIGLKAGLCHPICRTDGPINLSGRHLQIGFGGDKNRRAII